MTHLSRYPTENIILGVVFLIRKFVENMAEEMYQNIENIQTTKEELIERRAPSPSRNTLEQGNH